MRELTPLGFTNPSVAEVWAFESVPIGAVGALFTVAVESKGPAYWRTWRHFHVSIPAVRFVAAVLGKVQASGSSLGDQIMGKVASIAVDAFALLKEVLAGCNLLWVVRISASWAVEAGT
jgi:hypothetical protein